MFKHNYTLLTAHALDNFWGFLTSDSQDVLNRARMTRAALAKKGIANEKYKGLIKETPGLWKKKQEQKKNANRRNN